MLSKSAVYDRKPVSYSIWFMPEGNAYVQLKSAINSLSTDFGGPTFEPHVTLVSSFLGSEEKLLQGIKMIAKKIEPFEIFFGGITYLDKFFRSLFLKVKFSLKLQKARDIACDELSYNNNNFMPHSSLAYGDYNNKEKEKMISIINSIPNHFFVNKIFLAHNDEINLKWKVIQGFPLIK